jgi:uncharacterized repeat protein (TIGR03803 family)
MTTATGHRWIQEASILHAILATLLYLAAVPTCTQAQTFKRIYSFRGGSDGANPLGSLVLDEQGNLYGTTQIGGSSDNCLFIGPGCGTVFKIDPQGRETVLHRFGNRTPDGAYPFAGMIRDKAGNFYGTTFLGGAYRAGTVFKMSPIGEFRVLHHFAPLQGDGGNPAGNLMMDEDGNLFGTTQEGGGDHFCYGSCGTVFELDKSGTETVLLNFKLPSAYPTDAVIQDADGHLYGTTSGGSSSWGTVFELNHEGAATILYQFSGGQDGGVPNGSLVRDENGNLYGTTLAFGAYRHGVVFELTAAGQEKVLYAFKGQPDGSGPFGSLIRDEQGNLYGTTLGGGTYNQGTVYEIAKNGKVTILHSFTRGDGEAPSAGLLRDANGNLYGTASGGGSYGSPYCNFFGCGTVFKITP